MRFSLISAPRVVGDGALTYATNGVVGRRGDWLILEQGEPPLRSRGAAAAPLVAPMAGLRYSVSFSKTAFSASPRLSSPPADSAQVLKIYGESTPSVGETSRLATPAIPPDRAAPAICPTCLHPAWCEMNRAKELADVIGPPPVSITSVIQPSPPQQNGVSAFERGSQALKPRLGSS